MPLLPLEVNRLQYLVQQLPCAADEGLSLRVFIGSRRFTDEDNICVGIPYAENKLCTGRSQRAFLTIADRRIQFCQRRSSGPRLGGILRKNFLSRSLLLSLGTR